MFEEPLEDDHFFGKALVVKICREDDSFLIRKQTGHQKSWWKAKLMLENEKTYDFVASKAWL